MPALITTLSLFTGILTGMLLLFGTAAWIGDRLMGRRPSSSDEVALITQQGAPHNKGEDAVLANSLDGAACFSSTDWDHTYGD